MKYLNLKNIANELSVSTITVRRYIKQGKLSATRIGRDYRVSKDDLDQFLNKKSTPLNSEKTDETSDKSPSHLLHPNPDKHHKHKKPLLPGLNSHAIEAIIEMSSELYSVNEIRDVIATHARECIELIDKIEEEGITDPQIAINLLLIDEAIKNLQIRRNLFMHLLGKKAIVLLPLPPHLSDSFLAITPPEMVFVCDNNLPPHLKHARYNNLLYLSPGELAAKTKGVKKIVQEGYMENNEIFVRRSAANITYQLCFGELDEIFIHSIPHIPPNSEFIKLETGGSNIKISTV